MDKLSLEYLLKHGTQAQIDALKSFGKSSFNPETDKLSVEYDPSKFEGDFDSFCKTELGQILNGKELDAAFKIIDADSDGKISAEEAKNLAIIGDEINDGIIDNSDIKAIFNAGKEYSESLKNESETPAKTTEIHEDGSKTITEIKDDGTKVVTDYDNNGKKTSSVTTKPNGEETVKEYQYEEGKVVTYKTTTKDKDGSEISSSTTNIDWKEDGSKTITTKASNGKTTVTDYDKDGNKITTTVTDDNKATTTKYEYKDGKLSTTETTETKTVDGQTVTSKTTSISYVDGKKNTATVKDESGNILSTTSYSYDASSQLKETKTTKSNGQTVTTEYDSKTGNKKTSITVNSNNQVLTKITYDEKTGKKLSQLTYDYDTNGSRKYIWSYTYDSDEKLKTKDLLDSKWNTITQSTYQHNADGSMLRTDKDPETGNITGTKLFEYNDDGSNKITTTKDADGNITATKEFSYYDSGILKSKEIKDINSDGSYTLTVKSYSPKGTQTETKIENYDKDGNPVSNTNAEPTNTTTAEEAKKNFTGGMNSLVANFAELGDVTEQQRVRLENNLMQLYEAYITTEGVSESEKISAKKEIDKILVTVDIKKIRNSISWLKDRFAQLENPTEQQRNQFEADLSKLENEYKMAEMKYKSLFNNYESTNEELNAVMQNYSDELYDFADKFLQLENPTEQQRNQFISDINSILDKYSEQIKNVTTDDETFLALANAKNEIKKIENMTKLSELGNQITELKNRFARLENPTEQQRNQFEADLSKLENEYRTTELLFNGMFAHSESANKELNVVMQKYSDELYDFAGKFLQLETPTEQQRNQFISEINSILDKYSEQIKNVTTGSETLSALTNAKNEVKKIQYISELSGIVNQISQLKYKYAEFENPTEQQRNIYRSELEHLENQYNSLLRVIAAIDNTSPIATEQPEETDAEPQKTTEEAYADFKQNIQEVLQNYTDILLGVPTEQQRNRLTTTLNNILETYAATEGLSDSDLENAKNEIKKIQLTADITALRANLVELQNYLSKIEEPTEQMQARYADLRQKYDDALNEYENSFGKFFHNTSENEAINSLNAEYQTKINALYGKFMMECANPTEQQRNQFESAMKSIFKEYVAELNKTGEGTEIIRNTLKANSVMMHAIKNSEASALTSQINALRNSFSKLENPTEQQQAMFEAEIKSMENSLNALYRELSFYENTADIL